MNPSASLSPLGCGSNDPRPEAGANQFDRKLAGIEITGEQRVYREWTNMKSMLE
jgi:hypothetical protein